MLTDKAIKAAKPQPGMRYRKLADQGGLYLWLTTDGTRSWRYDYRLAGVRKTFTIGLYPDVSLAEAREHHSDARKLVAQGQCPVLIKRRKRQAAILGAVNTVRALGDAWYAELAPHKSESWREGTRGWLDRYIYPELGDLPAADVQAPDVLALIKRVAAKYPKTAEGLRQTLARIFAFAIRNLRVKTNPARELQGVIVVPPAIHHRPLKAPDIAPFLAGVRAYQGRRATVIAAELLLLTCVRKTELLGAKVSELNFETAEWRIPAERMKGGLEHIVPLSTRALELFREAVSINFGSDYAFPHLGQPDKHMARSTLNVMFDRCEFSVTPHAMRSTFSTAANESRQFRPDVIERVLAHVERNRVRGAYNAAEYLDERRAMLQWWADFIDRPANVVSIKKRA